MSTLQMMLQAVHKELALESQLAEIDLRAANVVGYRQYYDGEHVLQLTSDQRSMLRLIDRGFGTMGFNSNYMDRVVDTKADRLVLQGVEADSEAATEKVAELTDLVRLDRLSSAVTRHALRDADNFVMVSFDNDKKIPRLTEELAYDGTTGVIPIYRSEVETTPYAVLKIWQEANFNELEGNTHTTNTRLNIYYPDRVEKFISKNGNGVEKFYDTINGVKSAEWPVKWVDPSTGEALGIPIFHFRWNPEKNYGKSVLDDVIPVQDGFNRVLNSLIMASELTAFRLLAAFGFTPPANMTPGGWIVIGKDGLEKEDVVKIEQIQAGDLGQLLESAKFLKAEIHDSTNTPNPGGVASAASGEARKQYESFLVGELEAYQIQEGETWESVIEMAVKLWRVFGAVVVPEFKRLYARWKPAEIRDNAVLMANAGLARPDISRNTYLQTIAPVFEWDQAKIATIIEEKEADDQKQAEQLAASMPGFGDQGDVGGFGATDNAKDNTQKDKASNN